MGHPIDVPRDNEVGDNVATEPKQTNQKLTAPIDADSAASSACEPVKPTGTGRPKKRVKVTREQPSQRLAVALVKEIERDVVRRGWPVGAFLGSEPELIARYGVSRSVFREAVRLLDSHRVARMRSGPGGGLTVSEPDADAVIHAAELFLNYRRVSVGHLLQAREMVELAALRTAAEQLDEAAILRLRNVLDRERDLLNTHSVAAPDAFQEFHAVLAELGGNPAVQLFAEILGGLAAHGPAARTPSDLFAIRFTAHEQHAQILEAIIAGDVAHAIHRMRSHLEWTATVLTTRL